MKVYWATKLRGFLRHISEHMQHVTFIDNGRYYEVKNWTGKLKSKLIRNRLLDPIGLFQIVKVSGKDCDCYGSFNRFLSSDKPYFIYLENPTALYHYALGRIRYGIGKKQFQKCLHDPNLKYIVCMSDACRTTFEKVNMPLPENVRMKTIYPFVPRNVHVDENMIRKKCYDDVLECLYCVQGKSFYTKGGRDVLEVVTRLQGAGFKIHLTVITNLSALHEETLALIQSREDITLHDFTFPYDELEQIYAKTAVLLQPSSADSLSLTVLEAMKGGCAILGSKLYGCPEMVEHNGNGILIEPMYRAFTPDNLPNPIAWGHHKKVRLSKKRCDRYINDIEQAVRSLYEDRDQLYSFAKRSLELANTKFGEDTICDQWQGVWDALGRSEDHEV